MIYKVLIVKNRFKKKLDLSKYLDWFKLNTPIEVVAETITTDFDVTTEKVTNGTYTGVIVGGDIVGKLRTVIKENTYNAVIFVYGNSLDGIRVSCCNGQHREFNLYPNTELIQICKTDDGGKTANHEMFHGFFAKANRYGIQITDPMDTYQNDKDLSLKSPSNRVTSLERLAPHWNLICSFNPVNTPVTPNTIPLKTSMAILIRQPSQNVETLGDLVMVNDGNFFMCKTLELVDKKDSKGNYCVPKGTYTVKWTLSPKFKKYTYEVMNVPNMSGVRIHAGNYHYDTEGCILLGDSYSDINKDGLLDVLNSRIAVAKLEVFFGQKDFTLIII